MKRLKDKIIVYVLLTSVLLLSGFIVLKLWNFCIMIPYSYSGQDDFTFYSIAKNVMSGYSFWNNPSLSAPVGQDLYQFPMLMGFFTSFCRLIAAFGGNWIIAVNLYYFCTYILAGLSFFYLGRTFEVKSSLVLMLGSIAYAFSQYHIRHGHGHLTASAYFVVPLFISICFKISQDRYKKIVDIIILMVLSGLIGIVDVYYSFFGCFLLSVGFLASLIKKQFRRAFYYLASICSVSLSIVFVLFPAIKNMISSGTIGREVSAGEAFYWGLQFEALFVPAPGSKGIISGITAAILKLPQVPKGENLWNYVGIIGILGAIRVMYLLFFDTDVTVREKYVCRQLVATLVLGCISGLGVFVALFMISSIRCYNRISVYVFALMILLVCLFADQHLIIKKWGVWVAIVIALLHLVDLSSWSLIGNYSNAEKKFQIDEMFVQSVDEMLDDGDYVLQLPYAAGFENQINGISNCNYHFRTYLQSKKNIGWSFGGLSNTKGDENYKKYDTCDIRKILSFATSDGYSGIYLDKSMYDENMWNSVYNNICRILGQADVVSEDELLYYFNLKGEKRETLGVGFASSLELGNGFYPEETDGTNTWHWSDQKASLKIFTNYTGIVLLRSKARSFKDSGVLEITVNDKQYIFDIDKNEQDIELPIILDAGSTLVSMNCDTVGYENDSDIDRSGKASEENEYTLSDNGRHLSFMIRDLSVELPANGSASDFIFYGEGFWPLEQNGNISWSWSTDHSLMKIYSVDCDESMLFFDVCSYTGSGKLKIATEKDLFEYTISDDWTTIAVPLSFESDICKLTFDCDSADYEQGDKSLRYLSFVVSNLRIDRCKEHNSGFSISARNGIWPLEGNVDDRWIWSETNSSMILSSGGFDEEDLAFTAYSFLDKGELKVIVNGSEEYIYRISDSGDEIVVPVLFAGGKSEIEFCCDTAGYENGDQDLRKLSFRMENFEIRKR